MKGVDFNMIEIPSYGEPGFEEYVEYIKKYPLIENVAETKNQIDVPDTQATSIETIPGHMRRYRIDQATGQKITSCENS